KCTYSADATNTYTTINLGASNIDSNGGKRASWQIPRRARIARPSLQALNAGDSGQLIIILRGRRHDPRSFSSPLAQLATCIRYIARPRVVRALLGSATRRGVRLPDAGGCRRLANLRADGQRIRPRPGRARAVPALAGIVARRRPRRGPV